VAKSSDIRFQRLAGFAGTKPRRDATAIAANTIKI